MIVILWRAGQRIPGSARAHRTRHALELAREGVPLNTIQRQLGDANHGTTSIYLIELMTGT